MNVVAWRTECLGVVSIVFAKTRGAARFATLRAAMDVGYRLKFTEVSARRAKEFDARRYKGGDVASLGCPHRPEMLEMLGAKP